MTKKAADRAKASGGKQPAKRSRWHAWNERQARGGMIVPVEVDDFILGNMLDRGQIADRDALDRKKIGKAIRSLLLANALGHNGPDGE